MKSISEYDMRQLNLMKESLSCFEKKQIGLHALVGDLFGLFSALESVGEEFGEIFLEKITPLETIHAIETMDDDEKKGIKNLSEHENNELINKCVVNLKQAIENRLKLPVISQIKLNEHQYKFWKVMIGTIDSYINNETQDFDKTVAKLEKTLDSSEFKDLDLISEWYVFWKPLEDRRAKEGNQVDKSKAIEELTEMKKFILNHLAKAPPYNEH